MNNLISEKNKLQNELTSYTELLTSVERSIDTCLDMYNPNDPKEIIAYIEQQIIILSRNKENIKESIDLTNEMLKFIN